MSKTVNDVNEMDVESKQEAVECVLQSIDMNRFDRQISELRDDIFQNILAKRTSEEIRFLTKSYVTSDLKTYLSVKLIHDLQCVDAYSNPQDSYTNEMLSGAFPSRHANRLLRRVFAEEIVDEVAVSESFFRGVLPENAS